MFDVHVSLSLPSIRVLEGGLLDEKRLFLFLLFDWAIIGFIVHHVVCFHNCVRCVRARARTYTHTYINTHTRLYTIMGH